LLLSVICWRSGAPIEGEQEGESQPFRGWKGQVFPACNPRKGHFGSIEAKGQGSPSQKYLISNEIKELQKNLLQNPGNSGKITEFRGLLENTVLHEDNGLNGGEQTRK